MGVVENMKDVAEIIKKFGDIDLNRKILTLENEVLDLTRDKRAADEKVDELQRTLKFSRELTFNDPYYFAVGDPSPYCPACWDAKKLAVRVVSIQSRVVGIQKQCPSCKHTYDHGSI